MCKSNADLIKPIAGFQLKRCEPQFNSCVIIYIHIYIDHQPRLRPIKTILIILEMKSTDERREQPADNAFTLHSSCK
jgi:hypothetical protein